MNKYYKIIFQNLLIVVLIVFSLPTHGQTISTYAGGAIDDGIIAANAELNEPNAVAFDSFGNLYITDKGNNSIRKVDHITGIITRVAGNGTPGFFSDNGDNGPATNAVLGEPASITFDASNNLYITDDVGMRIRRVDYTSGIITTVAGNGHNTYAGDGGQATSTAIGIAGGIVIDALGDLYISDQLYNRIRKVDHSTGIITTIAGNGSDGSDGVSGDNGLAASAALSGPASLVFDGAGNLYVAERGRNVIRKIDHSTGIITTVAGNGTGGYSGDNGQATAAQLYGPDGMVFDNGGSLYISDSFDNVIRKIDFTTGIVTTVAGNGSYGFSGDNGQAITAQLFSPIGISFNSSGDLLIADAANNRIRKVDLASGVIATIAGNGFAGFSGDNVQRLNAQLNKPSSIAIDDTGDMFIADEWNNRVRKIDHATGIVTTVAGNGTIGLSGDNGPSAYSQIGYPQGLALDASGNLYFSDSYYDRIRRINKVTGIITTIAGSYYGFSGDNGPATAAKLSSPSGIAIDGIGNLYIADTENNRIRRVDLSTGIISTVAGNGTASFSGDNGPASAAALNKPSDVAFDNAGNLYISDARNKRVRKMDMATGIITTIAGTGSYGFSGDNGPAMDAKFGNPEGVTFDNSGNLYISDSFLGGIRRVDLSTGIISLAAGGKYGFSGDNGPATAAALQDPSDVAFDSNNMMFIADLSNNRIRKVTAVQVITFLPLAAKAYADEPFDLSATSSSGLPITFSSADPTVATVSGNKVTLVAAGSTLITASQGGNDIFAAADVSQILTVNKAAQTITFSSLPAMTYGDASFVLSATSSSGLAIAYASSDATVAAISGDSITVVSAGSTIITASQPGNANFNAASATQTLCVSPAKPTIIVSLSNPATPVLTSSANTGNQWFLNGTAISGATNPTFTTAESGQYTVQVFSACGVNPTSDPVSIAVAGLEVPVMSGTYPNPAAEAIYYRTPELNEPVSIQIVTVLGQVIKQTEFSFGGELRIELDGLTTGNYIFRATQGHQLQTVHFFKK